MHASIAVVAKEWKSAGSENCSPNLQQMSVNVVTKGCANTKKHYPDWPTVLHLADLSTYVDEQPPEKHWWAVYGSPMNQSAAEDSTDGMWYIPSCSYSDITYKFSTAQGASIRGRHQLCQTQTWLSTLHSKARSILLWSILTKPHA